MPVIEIDYAPRRWAQPFHTSVRRWAALVLHRRAGKTTCLINHHQRAACDNAWERARLSALLPDHPEAVSGLLAKRRIYWHVMPSYKQAKLVAWLMLKDHARPIPGVKFNESELLAIYPNGNRVQLIGADDPDSLRGPGLAGLSMDEYSQIPPNAFGEILSKALADQLGYCVWAGTIKGHDQLYQTYEAAKGQSDWFTLWQDIDESLRTEEGPTVTALERAMADDRKLVLQGVMSQAEFDQEWYLSPDAAIHGAIYLSELTAARQAGRIGVVPYDPALPVDTDWDLGVGDSTAIWFSQSLRSGEVRLIDYYEASGEGLPHYAHVLTTRGYVYGEHWAPHDIAVKELGSGRSRIETAASLGIRFKVVPKQALEDGIHAGRMLFPRLWFDAGKCKAGIESLAHYRWDYNARLRELKATPVHDVHSHAADAYRGLAVRHQVPRERMRTSGRSWLPQTGGAEMNWAG